MRPLKPFAASESLVADEMRVDFQPTPSGCQTPIAPSSVGDRFVGWQAAGPWPQCNAAFAAVLGGTAMLEKRPPPLCPAAGPHAALSGEFTRVCRGAFSSESPTSGDGR